jgi:hypothetical protein
LRVACSPNAKEIPVPLTRLGGECTNGINCAAVYDDSDGPRVIVQGYTGHGAELDPPAGEAAVAIPREVLLAAADALRARQ